MPRNGKIARLPRSIREQLNRKIGDAEPGAHLVDWLNSLDPVKRVLERDFGGRPVTEQNLSEWRQGGFVDWQQHQDNSDWVGTLTGDAEHLTGKAGVMPISDRLATMVSVSLGRLIPTLAADALSDAAKREDFWRLLRELGRLRRDDFESLRVRSYREMNHRPRRSPRASGADLDEDDDELL
jgi:hypothetical protein